MTEACEIARLGDVWRQASKRIDRLDARLLLEYVFRVAHADFIARPELPLVADQLPKFWSLVERRAKDEPLAYLTKAAGFFGESFEVSPAVLIPRSDTELLVELAVERATHWATPRLVDLGTGSGVIAIMVARLCPEAKVTAVDVSEAALAVAKANAQRLAPNVRFLAGSWYSPLATERFDIIVSNPPYIVEGDSHLTQNGLPFEPSGALTDGVVGGDGLACIRTIIEGAGGHLHPEGWLLIEHGYDQAVEVRSLLAKAGFASVASWQDLGGIERVSGGCWRSTQ